MNATLQDINLWEIWIEYDQFHPEYFGTLYVHGEIWSDNKHDSSLIKLTSDHQGELTLQLPERPNEYNNTREVVYSEPIRNLNQYTSVAIYSGKELIGFFNDIEIMI